jgi:ribosomal protein S18 acetylase RimI-like enzyme
VSAELDRALAFEKALRERCAERIVPFRFGRAYFNDSFPRVWDLNTLRVEGARFVDPGELAADAELLHTDAGQTHRRIDIPDERLAADLESFFRGLRWRVEREVVMAYRGDAERAVDTSVVEEVEADDLRPLREEIARAEPWATDDEVVRMVVDANGLWARAGNGRHLAVRVDGQVAAATDLYSDGRTAQIEDVATAPAHRGRGYASALVLRAVEEAVAAGHDLVFLTADDEDWPKELYARLGFAPVGRTVTFLRTPGQPRSSGSRGAPSRATGES